MVSQKYIDRFYSYIKKDSRDGCWEWLRSTSNNGYGQFLIGPKGGQKRYYCHRLSWELAKGPIPAGSLVCHKCDNRKCVNPSHLFLGSHLDNTTDMMNKGRHRWTKVPIESIAKLSMKKASEIRRNRKGLSITELAKKYNVSSSCIKKVRSGKTWRSKC